MRIIKIVDWAVVVELKPISRGSFSTNKNYLLFHKNILLPYEFSYMNYVLPCSVHVRFNCAYIISLITFFAANLVKEINRNCGALRRYVCVCVAPAESNWPA